MGHLGDLNPPAAESSIGAMETSPGSLRQRGQDRAWALVDAVLGAGLLTVLGWLRQAIQAQGVGFWVWLAFYAAAVLAIYLFVLRIFAQVRRLMATQGAVTESPA